jgi:hypothetical protein
MKGNGVQGVGYSKLKAYSDFWLLDSDFFDFSSFEIAFHIKGI